MLYPASSRIPCFAPPPRNTRRGGEGLFRHEHSGTRERRAGTPAVPGRRYRVPRDSVRAGARGRVPSWHAPCPGTPRVLWYAPERRSSTPLVPERPTPLQNTPRTSAAAPRVQARGGRPSTWASPGTARTVSQHGPRAGRTPSASRPRTAACPVPARSRGGRATGRQDRRAARERTCTTLHSVRKPQAKRDVKSAAAMALRRLFFSSQL
eukprot:4301631-Prymnesium_polylepis.2